MKTIIILDYSQLKNAFNNLDVNFEPEEFLTFLKSLHNNSDTQTAYIYVTINPKLPHENDRIIDKLWQSGYIVREVKGEIIGINFIADSTQYITLDIMREVYENKVDNVILVSNSNKLSNLAVLLRGKNVLVENVFFSSEGDYDLAVKSNKFIDLENFIKDDEYEQNNPSNEDKENDVRDFEISDEKDFIDVMNNLDGFIKLNPSDVLETKNLNNEEDC